MTINKMRNRLVGLTALVTLIGGSLIGCGGPPPGAELEPATKDGGTAVGRLQQDKGAESVTGDSTSAASDK